MDAHDSDNPAGSNHPPGEEKGDSPRLCNDHGYMVPASGPFRQMGTVPFFPSRGRQRQAEQRERDQAGQ